MPGRLKGCREKEVVVRGCMGLRSMENRDDGGGGGRYRSFPLEQNYSNQ